MFWRMKASIQKKKKMQAMLYSATWNVDIITTISNISGVSNQYFWERKLDQLCGCVSVCVQSYKQNWDSTTYKFYYWYSSNS